MLKNCCTFPGKIVSGFFVCHIPWGNREHGSSVYDVAVGTGAWRRSNSGTQVPACAVLVGFDNQRRNVFACRASHQTFLLPGRVSLHKIVKSTLNFKDKNFSFSD
jgi:hypothetical protein